jgi:hypothetical protein
MNQSDFHQPPPSLPSGSKVIAYLRDSGRSNLDENIGEQEKSIRDFCEKHGLVLTKIYSDYASGTRTKDRRQFLEVINALMNCPDELRHRGLLLWSFSRFSRDISDYDFYFYMILKKGVVIHSLTDIGPVDSPDNAKAPLGYIALNEPHNDSASGIKWVPDPEYAPIVQLAFELRAQGKSIVEITNILKGQAE